MIALAPKIATRTEARRLADIGPAWCIVARQPTMDGGDLLRWRWTLPAAEAEALIAARDDGVIRTVTGREAGGVVLYARRLGAMPAGPGAAPGRRERGAVEVAIGLLTKLADDPLVPPSYRMKSREYLRQIAPPPPARVRVEVEVEEIERVPGLAPGRGSALESAPP